jgi:DNA (cytosine-5)-methyltransferase 1
LTHQLVDLAERRAAMPDQHEAAGWWGERQSAVDRWERAVGRPAPEPAARGKSGGWVSSAAFTEWAMGLPAGWVADPDLGLTRAQQLHALGNGVVPQQAAAALRALLAAAPRTG